MIENRKMERYSLNLKAKITLSDGDGKDEEVTSEVITRDVSSMGAFFLTAAPFPVGSSVKVDMLLQVQQKVARCLTRPLLKMTGRVIRSESDGMAVCFNANYRFAQLTT